MEYFSKVYQVVRSLGPVFVSSEIRWCRCKGADYYQEINLSGRDVRGYFIIRGCEKGKMKLWLSPVGPEQTISDSWVNLNKLPNELCLFLHAFTANINQVLRERIKNYWTLYIEQPEISLQATESCKHFSWQSSIRENKNFGKIAIKRLSMRTGLRNHFIRKMIYFRLQPN